MANSRNLLGWKAQRIADINEELKSAILVQPYVEPDEIVRLLKAMHYVIDGGGKRFRALIALACAEAVGGKDYWAMPGALAVELIHAYSLIHDDLPALDDDELRRGRPTCHLVFGEATAILAGDALQSLAFETLANGQVSKKEMAGPDDPKRKNQALVFLAQAIGAVGMAGGQAMDLAFEGSVPDFDDVLNMEIRKTGCLIGASMAIGASLGGADKETAESLNQIGQHAGLAFQITDDLLNQTGDPEIMGKNVGTDEKKRKATALVVMDQDKAAYLARKLIKKAIHDTAEFNSAKLSWLLGSIIGRTR
ncbi:MAG: polyprenyl synthetase family protein [Deltaproteobacteria bacterium]|jgi:geranylgeranyl pyrophosphate synthase|nr:polyprenyl synthetase family protein [Deltaproteobacteria bacterium]